MIPVLEVGGTHVTAALVDPPAGPPGGPGDARVGHRARRPLDPHGTAREVLDAVLDCAGALPTEQGATWGVAVPGPFDYACGVALFEGVGKFDALHGVDVRAALLAGLPRRPAEVVFLNDAHAFAAGEWRAGAGRGHRRCVGVTLGTGVGSAFLVDGLACQEGPGVPPEGRMDLTLLHGRPLEEWVSRRALLARYGEPGADVQDLADRARAGERRARRLLDGAFTDLGGALGPRLRAFDASVLVVGGSIAASWDLVGPALRAGVGHTPVAVRRSALGGDAALVGAAYAAVVREAAG